MDAKSEQLDFMNLVIMKICGSIKFGGLTPPSASEFIRYPWFSKINRKDNEAPHRKPRSLFFEASLEKLNHALSPARRSLA